MRHAGPDRHQTRKRLLRFGVVRGGVHLALPDGDPIARHPLHVGPQGALRAIWSRPAGHCSILNGLPRGGEAGT